MSATETAREGPDVPELDVLLARLPHLVKARERAVKACHDFAQGKASAAQFFVENFLEGVHCFDVTEEVRAEARQRQCRFCALQASMAGRM